MMDINLHTGPVHDFEAQVESVSSLWQAASKWYSNAEAGEMAVQRKDAPSLISDQWVGRAVQQF